MSIIENIICGLLAPGRLPYPKTISVEPISNLCQLKCPLCPTGLHRLNYDHKIMSLETFKIILDKMPFLRSIDLYKSGEPFLNPDTLAMARLAHDRGIEVIISTNFSFSKPDEFFENIVKSGLRQLVVSLDGASQETYSQYRKNGDFELVMANIRKLIDAKKRLNSKNPEIVLQYLVNRFNENEIAAAQDLADQLQITLNVRPMDLLDELPDFELEDTLQQRMDYWLPTNKKYICDRYLGEYKYPLFKGICAQLFTRAVVTADGKILPCCETWDRSSVFGDLITESFEDIWNNQKYMNSRALFLKKNNVPTVRTVCFKCKNYSTTPSVGEKLALLITLLRKNYGYLKRKIF